MELHEEEMQEIRGEKISMIFQEPMTSLNPAFTVGDQIAEVFRFHRGLSKPEAWGKAVEELRRVEIPDPEKRARSYPHELSGGMRQRAMIAIALACRPRILIADEPTTALDVTIQAQILKLIAQLQREIGMSVILITHNLGIVAQFCSRIYVMYAGKMVEHADTHNLFHRPLHPYTRGLLRSVIRLNQKTRRVETMAGLMPDLIHMPPGCAFHPRCDQSRDVCRQETPEWREVEKEHWVACHQKSS
jgi:oligopeptide/dipeptide ABC transporter ATP-binding protein